MSSFIKKNSVYFAFAAALFAMCGSLFFSEIRHLPPCVLCWYQRILMYPLVAILAVGIIRRDKGLAAYVLPLSITGACFAAYHFLLYMKVIPDALAPCSIGISCTSRTVQWLGFINIPFMSLCAFIFIIIMMIIYHKNREQIYD